MLGWRTRPTWLAGIARVRTFATISPPRHHKPSLRETPKRPDRAQSWNSMFSARFERALVRPDFKAGCEQKYHVVVAVLDDFVEIIARADYVSSRNRRATIKSQRDLARRHSRGTFARIMP